MFHLQDEEVASVMACTSTLPDLSTLQLKSRDKLAASRLAGDGIYCLNDISDVNSSNCESRLIVLRGVFSVPAEAQRQAFEWMQDESNVPKTPNPMNQTTFIKRRQCTFGYAYSFGQKQTTVPGPPERWPVAVQMALVMARAIALQTGNDPSLYNGVHANLYVGPDAGVQPHTDKEGEMVKGVPIISFTMLGGTKVPRDFQVYELDKKTKVAEIQLGDGDVVVMDGKMQEQFMHAVDKVKTRKPPDPQPVAPKDFKNSMRINFTVRAFRTEELDCEPAPAKRQATGEGLTKPVSPNRSK